MELLKKLLDIILNFSWIKRATKEQDNKVANAVEDSIVERVRADANTIAVQKQEQVRQTLEQLDQKHKRKLREVKNADADELDKLLDDQFGSDQ